MKKTLFIVLATVLSSVWICTNLAADWSKPIPVGSTENQVRGGSLTKTDATYIKFYHHPVTPAGTLNYSTNYVWVEGSDTARLIEDVAGVTGLLPNVTIGTPDFKDMLDDMLLETYTAAATCLTPTCLPPMTPTHGFCPEALTWILSGHEFKIIFECDATREPTYRVNSPNITDRQVETFDARNTISGSEFNTIIGGSPLELGAPGHEAPVGDARDTTPPIYTAETYPATIRSTARSTGTPGFAWRWGPYHLDEPYDHNISYGIAQIDGNFVTALYDPVMVEKFVQMSWIYDMPPNTQIGSAVVDGSMSKFYEKWLLIHTPLVFLRADDDKDRMLLSGYSTWQLSRLNLSGTAIVDSLINFFLKMITSLNLNPVDVENVGNDFIAVVNQATLSDVDGPIYARDGTTSGYNWRQVLSTDTVPAPLPDTGTAGSIYFPHSLPSYVTIWEKKHGWTKNPADLLTDNPNEIFDNTISRTGGDVPGFALVGGNPFDSTVVKDTVGGTEKLSLVVASTDIDKTNTSYYIYKISPNGEKLYLDATVAGSTWKKAIGIAGEPYKVRLEVPAGVPDTSYSPHSLASGNFNGDNCGDLVITWRGAETVWDMPPVAPKYFYNHPPAPQDKVHYNRSPHDTKKEMFSEYFSVYLGKEVAGKCQFEEPSAAHPPYPMRGDGLVEPKWQIAAVDVFDFNGDGYDDIVVGNLNPMKLADGSGLCSAYVAIFHADAAGSFDLSAGEFVRVGYATTNECPVGSGPTGPDEGEYLIKVWNGSGAGRAGVSAIDVDVRGNISSVIGLPRQLPSFNCPKFIPDVTDTTVESPLTLYLSLLANKINPGVSWGPSGDIVPMHCVGSTPPPGGGGDCLTEAALISDPAVRATAENCCKPGMDCSSFVATGCCPLCIPATVPPRPWCIPPTDIPDIPTCCSGPPPGGGHICLAEATAAGYPPACCTKSCSTATPAEKTACCSMLSTCDDTLYPGYCAELRVGFNTACCMSITTIPGPVTGIPGGGLTYEPRFPDRTFERPGGGDLEVDMPPATGTFRCPYFKVPEDHRECCINACVGRRADGTEGSLVPTIQACYALCTPDYTTGSILRGEPVIVHPGGRSLYPDMCNRLQQLLEVDCYLGKKSGPLKNKFFAGSSGGDGGGSDYARCDHVYSTKAPYIADIDSLKPAATQVNEASNAAADIQAFLQNLGMSEAEAADIVKKLQKAFTDDYLNFFVMPFLNIMNEMVVPENMQKNASLPGEQKSAGISALIKEAYANLVADHTAGGIDLRYDAAGTMKKSRFRLPRAHVPPGSREVTVVVNKSLVPPGPGCGDGRFDPALEMCDATDPAATAPWACPDSATTACDALCNCVPPDVPGYCGDGVLDPVTEGCEADSDCPSDRPHCVGCFCFTTPGDGVPDGGPDGGPEDGCPPCCPCCPETQEIVVKCVGGSSPAAIELREKMNEMIQLAAPGIMDNDFVCEADYGKFVYRMNVPGGAAPSVERSVLLSSSVNPILPGNIGNFAMVQVSGNRTKDFTEEAMLPLATDMISQPTILLPVSADISTSFGKATTVPVDLSLTAGVTPYGVSLSEAVPISSASVTSYDVIQNNTLELNKVVTLKVTGRDDAAKGAGEIGQAVVEATLRGQPLLCSWSARCAESEAVINSAMNFGNVDFNQVLNVIRDNATECQNGVCSPALLQKLNEVAGWPLYTMNTVAFVQGKVVRTGEMPVPPTVTVTSNAFGPPMEAARGGCKCDMTASAPSVASIIALLILIATALGGFMVVRVRSKGRS